MKARKKYIILAFCLITVVNCAIFFYKDDFAFHKIGTYTSLYSSDTSKWKKFINDYPKQELAQAKILLDSLLKIQDQPADHKIVEIGKLLYDRFSKRIEKPSVSLLNASPLNQFKILSSSDSVKLWCGNFAIMMAYFCWSEGIPSRVIEIINPGDHHVVNECFLAGSREWVMVDVTSNHLLLLNKSENRYLNLLNVRDSLKYNLKSFRSKGNAIVIDTIDFNFYNRYLGNKCPIYYYYRVNTSEVYKINEKIKRYFLPDSWYEEVDEGTKANFLFYIKQIFALLWLVFLIISVQHIFKK
jgi:hypothetical protein